MARNPADATNQANEPVNDLSMIDRLAFALTIEQHRSAQMALQIAQMKLDHEKVRIRDAYALRDVDSVDPVSGHITRA